MLKSILGRYNDTLEYEHFNVRTRLEVPDLSYDVYIFSGGPGDPLESGGNWQAPFFDLIQDLWQYNLDHEVPKKYCFFICHSFQMACHHFKLGEVSQRFKMSFGTFPVYKTHDGKTEPFFEGLPDPFYIADFRRYQVTAPNKSRFKVLGAQILCLEKLRPHTHFERAIMAVRFSPEMIGTQFHPEADPEGLLNYFREEERHRSIVEEYGEARYNRMIHDLAHPQKIRRTFETMIPAFLEKAIMELEEVLVA